MFLIYDAVFLLYAVVYLPYLLLTRRAYKGFAMRLGLFSPQVREQIKGKANIWLHAVSVGEVMVLDGFIDRLKKSYPAYQLIVTVTTKTGYALACERLKAKAVVVPSPLDFSFVANGFVSLIAPTMYIAVETEIWPNLYRQLFRHRIPLAVINGRISEASFGRYKAISFLLKGILSQVSAWCMQGARDAQRIRELGAETSRVTVTGNLKFDDLPKAGDLTIPSFFNQEESGKSLWWVAGSTHPGEEEIVMDVYSKIIQDDPRWKLVIVPRHIERASQIRELGVRRGIKDLIVVDTIGQLRSLYSIASLVFVGKSLCVGGGQNIIEPAFYGKAIIVGPRCANFRDVVACFKDADAIVQVDDVHMFEKAVRALAADPIRRAKLGAAAKAVITVNQGASQRSLERLAEFLS
jgi:3-deoxy-D-manno-octulosonic-acid transferase